MIIRPYRSVSMRPSIFASSGSASNSSQRRRLELVWSFCGGNSMVSVAMPQHSHDAWCLQFESSPRDPVSNYPTVGSCWPQRARRFGANFDRPSINSPGNDRATKGLVGATLPLKQGRVTPLWYAVCFAIGLRAKPLFASASLS